MVGQVAVVDDNGGGSSGATLTAGVARVVTTPPVGIVLTGFAGRAPSEGVHDDLLATALVLAERTPAGEDAAGRVALVTLDLLGMYGDAIASAINGRVEDVTGIPAERVFLSCSHTHYGPVVSPDQDMDGGEMAQALAYQAALPHHIAGVVAMADAAQRPVTLEAEQARLATQQGNAGSRWWNRRALAQARLALAALDGGAPLVVEGDLAVLRLGDAALACNPSELFCEIGTAIKAASPFPWTAISGYTDGAIWYVPTRGACPEGGYEVDRTCRFAPEAGELLQETTLRLLRAVS